MAQALKASAASCKSEISNIFLPLRRASPLGPVHGLP
jgi:hypothetical protein